MENLLQSQQSYNNLSMTQGDQLLQSNSMFKTMKETQILDPFLHGEYGSIIKWKALEIISEGTASTVYKAFDLNEGKFITVKKYHCISEDKREYEAFNVR